ncbi:MYB and HSA domain-containing protein [Trichophyton interdigitale]|uniref:Vacuolar import and degradation protein 21 n=1 Tax=Trichophyton interdigitale TaxID=101480 RepID=A0A9P4YGI2_9EURO|nr:MYB and HSA domain-containing protein [Trichophyton interdigitale]KAF3895793.1 MYB and HSA domain-containing protein [Trichophyton interdigitale]KAG8208853.1 MYB and HSA domain-containing protein [Trichophyton interdigitale]
MLSDRPLASRHDEIARCLWSRKRKLSELYYATATFPHPSDTSGHREPLARQKEAAFLDANDLSKGRLYDENTLPERPRLETVLAEYESKYGPPRPDKLDRPQTPVPQPAAGIASHEQPTQGGLAAGNGQPQLTVSSAGVQTTEPPETVQSVPSVQHQPNGIDTSHPQHAAEAPAKPASSPETAVQATTQATAHPLSPPETNRTSSFNDRLGVAPIIVPPKSTEAASSPMSTGPSSSHTSATERSPASSSTESVASITESPSMGKHSTDESPSNVQSQPISTAVPSTPDEQLQLEAAMSIRNSTTPKQPIIAQDKDGDQHMAEAPSELKEPQLKREPTESVTNSRPSSSSGPQTAPDGKTATKPVEIQRQPAEQQHSRPERMTTRVASGAIRHKSVSEILGESPKPGATPETEQHSRDSRRSSVFDRQTGTSHTSPASPSKLRLSERPDKERSRLSTVVFPKTSSQEKEKAMQLASRRDEETRKSPNEEQDYLYTLFQAKAHYPPRTMSLNTLLSTAHKTLSTSNHFLEYHEQMDCRTLKRIYQLQHSNRWALRQLQRSPEPPRQATHWDIMLDHVKWMRMDFREERKWKLTAAKRCAEWCADYVASDEDCRRSLRIPAKIPPPPATEAPETDKLMDGHPDEVLPNNHPTPDLIHSADDDSVSDGFNDEHPDFDDGNVPAAIFSSGSDEFTFRMERTIASEKILGELPFYCPVQIAPETNKPAFKIQPDDVWKTQLLPVSKYAQGTIQFKEDGPPRKRSRYDYEQDTYYDGEEENGYRSFSPEQVDVALFSPDYKALRDRIHPGNAFRPPTEYIMPPLGFYESRQSSHWTLAEDDELRKLVQEYSFNWSLIASCLAPRSSFVSTSERRTPWECFERWISLEGLPPDMAKTPYFRTYNARLEAAQRTIMNAQQQAVQQQQQQQQNGGQVNPSAQALIRRRTAQPLRVERKRSSRHLALLAGMRKLSQKRETNLQKQQHATQLASMRKVNEATQPRPPISTPQEFSQLKHERELKFLEKQEQYRQQMIAHQRAAMAQRAAQLNPSGQFNGMPVRPPAAVPNGAGGVQVPIANGLANGIPNGAAVSQSRPHPGMAAMPNGLPATGPIPVPSGMSMKMMPQQGLQQPINGRPGLPIQTSPDNSRIIREANRLQEQQRLLQSRQQQHQFHGGQQGFAPQQGPHSSPNMNATPATTSSNPALMAAFQAATNGGSPSFAASSLTPGVMPASSPRMNHPSTSLNNAPSLPNVNNIQASLQRLHPTMSQEQVSKLATERLQQYQQQRLSQAALNAAAGNLGVGNLPSNYQAGNSGQQIPQQGTVNGVSSVPMQNQTQGYMNRLGVSQAGGQQNRPGVGIASPAMTNMLMHQSRSATPQSQRPSSQGGPQQQQQPQQQQAQPPPPGKSPRPAQAQTASS